MKYMIGSDPEFFLYKDGSPVASQGIIEGSKFKPFVLRHGSAVHRDNVMGELNPRQADTEDEFVYNINKAVEDVQELLSPFEVDLAWEPFVEMPEDQLLHWEAMVFGCDPDIDCWGIDFSPPPNPHHVGNIRSAGGHVHLGWLDLNKEEQLNVAKMADVYLGLGSLFYDSDNRRRRLYGKAGRFRYKPYGVEYRVLSNRWMADENLMRWVFRSAVKAIENMDSAKGLTEKDGQRIHMAINECNLEIAEHYITMFEGEIPECQIHMS